MPEFRVNTPQGAVIVTAPNNATSESVFGFVKALGDSGFWKDVGSRLSSALTEGVRDTFPTGASPGGSVAQAGAPVDPAYREKMINLALGMGPGVIKDIPAPKWMKGGTSVPVAMNPTKSEINELLRIEDTLRTLRNETTGELYAWPASQALHSDVGAFFKLVPRNTAEGIIVR